MPFHKYAPYEPIGLADRTWPGRRLTEAPLWCSVDLRDGNQALIDPMDVARKREMFDLLVSIGFKEIEVGYPAASQDEYDFVRHLIETDAIPDDVVIQVLTPIRAEALERSVAAVRGARKAIVQYIIPTSTAQRRVVFRASREEMLAMALAGARQAVHLQETTPETEILLSFLPESFTQTEPDFALEVCNAVQEYCAPRTDRTLRITLPATVEAYPPHEFADRVEYMSRELAHRDRTILTVHPHNDRGSAVAATELALLAGADRVEGCLFGNGERTGNVCVPTLAMNLFSQGIDPMLDLHDLDGIRRVAEKCSQLPVSSRHPWVGEFVFTSFAGTHQDAIAKGLRAREEEDADAFWDVPYLPVDPRDIGGSYQALIRINTQSGKGGIAHLLRSTQGVVLPRRLQIDFAHVMQKLCEKQGGEVGADELWQTFVDRYVTPGTEVGRGAAAGGPETTFDLDRCPGDWRERAQHLLATLLTPATVRDLIVDRREGRAGHVAFCEVVQGTDTRALWGVGLHADEAEAVRGAVLATVRRARSEEPRTRNAPAASLKAPAP
ncbi:2-isopropylmalate synthase [Streptomyces sp. TRM76323]|uniref:2-isopropylmalate synthase n=1 Tax=Streptomyces tamarix TaxID=3078565 RepID=A0ABU3QPD8_9ACTN|nr:2-isopropylmalate synthase [Streptomyces tamarix]MDT9684612.1 2-isopropylmalate synthase [Streptomyces tamarix]